MAKPVVFVPGFPGSHLHERATGRKVFLNIPALVSAGAKQVVLKQLEGPDDLLAADPLRAGDPIRRLAKFLLFDLAKQADSLYDILEGLGIDAVKFGWDWRRPIWDGEMLASLAREVEAAFLRAGNRPVTLIAHSTGGLVVRRLLEARKADASFLDKVERVIAFGIPWAGTLKSFVFLTGAEGFGSLFTKLETQQVITRAWAAYDLLPPDPAKTPMTDAAGRPLRLVILGPNNQQTGPLVQQGWFDPLLKARMKLRADAADREVGSRRPVLDLGGRVLPVTNVVGWGEETTVRAVITGSAGQQTVAFIREKGDDLLGGGDGTVPRVSAAWLRGPGVETFHVPVGVDHSARMNPHSTLWRNPGGRNLLRHLLDGQPLEPFVYGAVDDEDAVRPSVVNVRVRLTALNAAGLPLSDATVQATDLNGGSSPVDPFNPTGEGRHLIRVPRARMRQVGANHRRFTLRLAWKDQGQPQSVDRSFFVTR